MPSGFWERVLPIGRRSLLAGAHQFLIHPLFVLAAWWKLYGRPSWKEVVCILVHDWGYWFAHDLDGLEGKKHPELGARLAGRWFGPECQDLCLYHSRYYARQAGTEPSRLCWADKLGMALEPWWLYLPRAWLSGELAEYRENAARSGLTPRSAGHRRWHRDFRARVLRQVAERRAYFPAGS
ncbi:MAG: hypothetical protein AB1816_00585 [Bacillota bacterium]